MIDRLAKCLLGVSGIVGVGHGSGLKIYVESERYLKAIPKEIAGIPVEVKVVGKIYALSTRAKVRPLLGGISVSNDSCMCSGTLGVIHDGLIYSNAHVLAMDVNYNFVSGANVIQPGYVDGGGDVVGKLKYYVDVKFNDLGADNYYDFATATPTVEYEEDLILGENPYHVKFGKVKVKSGDTVRKTGRTTGTTYGKVDSVCTSVKVHYGNKWAVFHEVVSVTTEGFCKSGDSGSVVDKDGKVVGLLFAGTDRGYGFVCGVPGVEVRRKVNVGELLTAGAFLLGLLCLRRA